MPARSFQAEPSMPTHRHAGNEKLVGKSLMGLRKIGYAKA
jgi:hypothetical protein